ncbi:hypothetical protein B0H16DRAFT_1713916 [Mycena metata]|uniref:Uncharacterized protein n=1 Tax=Mycena metata TaxID=1033252 RepID=A0AAD7JZX6_9AGAR|nr:hypothetical protein B0H16DRAFT_1713916 [Mycena metata]
MPSALSPDICWEIAQYATHAHLELLLLSKTIHTVVIPLLYRSVDIDHGAFGFVNSLANNSRLPPLVRTLSFGDHARVDTIQWASVLPAMNNLKLLCINHGIDFLLAILPQISFSLDIFGSRCSVVGNWATLIASQPTLGELQLNDDYYGAPPTVAQLPSLRAVKGRPADLARFARIHPLEDMWFFTGPPHARRSLKSADLALFASSSSWLCSVRLNACQLLLFWKQAPKVVKEIQHIVFDEDPQWCHFKREGESLAVVGGPLAAVNTSDRDPVYPPLLRADGEFFMNSFKVICPKPHFETFRVYARDGCITWHHWGLSAEQVSYLPPPPEHGPAELEEDYQCLFGN